MRRIIFALFLSVSTAVLAQGGAAAPLELAADAPERHIVVRGDTLWGVSSKFLKEAYRWPELWKMNAEQVRNPHRIYPGQILFLDRSGAEPRLRVGNIVRMGPEVRSETLPDAIPSIPAHIVEPFLSQPLVIDAGGFDAAPRIVATQESRVFTGTGDLVYAAGNADPAIPLWHVYRPGKPLKDPDTQETLGIEAIFLGSARPTGDRGGDVLSLAVASVKQEIGRGDYLAPAERRVVLSYAPRAPAQAVNGRVIAIYGGVGEAAANSIVSLSRGQRDGLEVGHVLALQRAGPTITNRFGDEKPTSHALPDERIGLLFVFRVFERVSYALVAQAQRPVMAGDRVVKP